MRLTTGLPFLVAMVMLFGCEPQTKEETTETTTEKPKAEADKLHYEFTTFTREYGDCKNDSSEYCTRINLSYPEFNSEKHRAQAQEINEQVQSYVLNQVFPDTVENKSIEMFADRFISDYKEIKEAFGEAFGWYAKVNGSVVRNDTSIVTVELTADLYTGGAHGNFNLQYLNFNPKTGKKITFASLFTAGYQQQLNNIVEAKFRAKYNISPDKDLSDEGYQFEQGKYYNEENFALLPEGIKFYYNSYEIAPYSHGPSEVLISYDQLKGILKKNTAFM